MVNRGDYGGGGGCRYTVPLWADLTPGEVKLFQRMMSEADALYQANRLRDSDDTVERAQAFCRRATIGKVK